MAKAILTAERLKELLEYRQNEGVFIWKARTSNRVKIGDVAGTANPVTGYLSISIDGKMYRSSRLAWLYVHDLFPEGDIDHINGIRTDNRIANLRSVNRSINQQNLRLARGDTHSGVLGVHRTDKKAKKWRASIKLDGRDCHLGNFETKELASAAYLEAKRKFHEGCTI